MAGVMGAVCVEMNSIKKVERYRQRKK